MGVVPRRGLGRGVHLAVVVALDQITKALVVRHLDLHQSVAIVPGLLDFTHVRNTGAAFGLLNAVEFPGKPVVIAGFEPLDVMQAILMLVRQVNEDRAEVENEFTRAVSRDGNLKAQNLVAEVFELRREFEWRGLGLVPYSALKIRKEFSEFDAELRFPLGYRAVPDNKACECGAILRGVKRPWDCKLFGTVCTPEAPMGSCMVSSEGACAAHYTYGRFKNVEVVSA